MDNDRVKLSYEDAVAMLDIDEGYVHSFRSTPTALLGADWGEDEAIALIEKYGAELAGPGATDMGHGLGVIDKHGPVFFKTK